MVKIFLALTNNKILASIVLFSGCLLSLAFAPTNLNFLAIVSPALLLYLIIDRKPKTAAAYGFLFGFGLFLSGVWWVYISIHDFGGTPVLLTLIFTLGFISFMAAYFGLAAYLLQRFWPKNNKTKLLFAFPGVWVLFEWLRSHFLTGFPWLLIGYSQTNTWLKGYAPLLSIYGVSWICLILAALVVIFFQGEMKVKLKAVLCIACIYLLGFGLTQIHWTQKLNAPIKVSLIQGNIAQELKWNPLHFQRTLELYKQLIQQELGQDIIILPESAFAAPFWLVEDDLQQIDHIAKQHDSTILVGVPVQAGQSEYFYNAMLAVGKSYGSYYKRHLVPFGEYLPFEKWLRGLINFFDIPMSNYIQGKLKQPDFIAKGLEIAPFICYEVAYPNLVYSALPDAQVLLTISDDSWFGKSNAAFQHLQIATMRAIETGRYMLFGTNNGVTAIINPQGKIQAQLPRFTTTVLRDQIHAMQGSTPLISYGQWPVLGLIGIMLLFSLRRQY